MEESILSLLYPWNRREEEMTCVNCNHFYNLVYLLTIIFRPVSGGRDITCFGSPRIIRRSPYLCSSPISPSSYTSYVLYEVFNLPSNDNFNRLHSFCHIISYLLHCFFISLQRLHHHPNVSWYFLDGHAA